MLMNAPFFKYKIPIKNIFHLERRNFTVKIYAEKIEDIETIKAIKELYPDLNVINNICEFKYDNESKEFNGFCSVCEHKYYIKGYQDIPRYKDMTSCKLQDIKL